MRADEKDFALAVGRHPQLPSLGSPRCARQGQRAARDATGTHLAVAACKSAYEIIVLDGQLHLTNRIRENMFDDFATYFYENVVRSFNEYHRTKVSGVAGGSNDIRTAMAAASALFHLREHLPRSFAMSRSKAERLCADYGVLADIANTSKHRALQDSTPHGAPLLKSAADLTEEIVITEYRDQEGPYKHVEKRVTAKLTDGTTRDVLEILTNVMNFLAGVLARQWCNRKDARLCRGVCATT